MKKEISREGTNVNENNGMAYTQNGDAPDNDTQNKPSKQYSASAVE